MSTVRSLHFASVCGLYCLLVGGLTLIGWFFDIRRLTDWDNRGISMFVNAAICAVLTGLGLLLSARSHSKSKLLLRVLGSAVGLIGGLTLVEHLSGWNLGIDTILIERPWGLSVAASPMRMGPPASVSYLALGGAFLLMSAHHQRLRRWASGICVAVAAIAMLSAIGYLYGAKSFFAVPHLTGIAFPTATVILAAAIGAIAAIPECGVGASVLSDDPGGAMLRRLLLPVLVVSLGLGWLRLAGQEVGLYDAAFGSAARTLVEISIVTALLFWAADGLRQEFAARQRADKALGAARSDLLEAQRIAHIGSWQWDAATGVTAASDELLLIFGFDPATEDMPDLRQQRGSCYPEAEWERIHDSIQRALTTGEGYELDAQAIRREGSPIWVTIRGEALRDAAGKIVGLRGTVQDITQRKQLEVERGSLLDKERTARAEMERLARAKDEFLATVSHELRSPLNAISLWAQLLRRGPIDAATLAEGAAAVENAIRSQARIIDDLVDLNRIAAGKLHMEMTQVDLSTVIEAATQGIQREAETKGVRILASIDRASAAIRGDAVRLRQLFSNLLSNAVKFTPMGGQVDIRLIRESDRVRVRVRDTGQGIRPEFLPHVFDPFAQADGSISRRHGGLGLGLAIVRSIAKLHQAVVSVESEGVGRGATFEVSFPALAAQGQITEIRDTREAVRGLAEIRILVTDDDAVAAGLIGRLMRDQGAAVKIVGGGSEVAPAIREFQPHLLLCDISMPEMDGYEVIRMLRDSGWTGPAIAVTAFARPEDRERAFRAGFNFHISKPVDFAELMAVVGNALKMVDQAGTAPSQPVALKS